MRSFLRAFDWRMVSMWAFLIVFGWLGVWKAGELIAAAVRAL